MLDNVGGAPTCQSNSQKSGDSVNKSGDDLDAEFAAFKVGVLGITEELLINRLLS